MDSTFEGRIRKRAYDLWLREGGVRGHVDHHWFQAVRDTLAAPDEVSARAPVPSLRRRHSQSLLSATDAKRTHHRSAAKTAIAG